MEQTVDNCLNDLEKQILDEEISYQFYDKSVNTVEYIGPQKQFKEMMWEEFNHVKLLRDKYEELGGSKQVIYSAEQHGGLAMPSKEIDTEVALDIGIKEEIESISKYDVLSKKYKDHNLSQLFNSLLKDERKHLSIWERAQIEYISKRCKPFGRSETYLTYRFTPTDLHVIAEAVKYWEEYFMVFFSRVESLHDIEYRDIMLSIIRKENEHTGLLENEYFRLKGIKPDGYKDFPDSQLESTNNASVNNKDIIDQIINGEKDCLIRFYDWGRMCTNSQLQEILWNIMEDKYTHLKQWAKIQ